ncbi:MAG: DUF2232 domain-containing protein [Janthinobacterium lividum]
MMKLLGIALGAGVTSAVLFAVVTTASPAALLLTYLSPLPIMIAALGFTHPAGAVAALVATITVGFVMGWPAGLGFLVTFGLPAWYLARLAQLGRPGTVGSAPTLAGLPTPVEWFPIPPLMLRVVALATLPILLAGALLIWRFGSFDRAVDIMATRLSSILGRDTLPGDIKFSDVVRLAPVVVAAWSALMLSVNLWLAGRAVKISERLLRPWPNLPDALRMPRFSAAAFAVFVAAGFLPDPFGLAATVVAAALGVLFVFEGLATAHVLSRGLSARYATLAAIYLATIFLMPLPLFALALLGLIDCLVPQMRRGSGIKINTLPKRKH